MLVEIKSGLSSSSGSSGGIWESLSGLFMQQQQCDLKDLTSKYDDSQPIWTEILLQNLENVNYVGTIHVGTPNNCKDEPQMQRCVFDTGSTNTWITTDYNGDYFDGMKVDYDGDISSANENLLFCPSLSSTFNASDYMCTILFGSGKLSGFFGQETIHLNYKSDKPTNRMVKSKNQNSPTLVIND
jgi:hypothetical protein